MKLLSVVRAHDGKHKYVAEVEMDNGRVRHTAFGAQGMDDYTLTHDPEQRARYRQRHQKDLATGDPTRAGFLSYHLLWGGSTSLRENIASYKKKYHL